MRMGQGVRTGLGHGGITCVLQTQFSSSFYFSLMFVLSKRVFTLRSGVVKNYITDSCHAGMNLFVREPFYEDRAVAGRNLMILKIIFRTA